MAFQTGQAPAAPAAPTPPMPTIDEVAVSVAKAQANASEAAAAAEAPKTVAVDVSAVTPEPAAVEPAPAADAKPEAPAQDDAAKRFAALARKEKAAREQAARLKDEMTQAQKVKAEAEAATKRLEEAKAKVKTNPLAAMQELGLTYEELTKYILEGGKAPEVDPLDAKLEPLNKELEELKQLREWQKNFVAQQEQARIAAADQQIQANIAEAAKEFELIQAFGQEGLQTVRNVMEEHFKNTKEILPYKDACAMVEKYYDDTYVSKLLSTKKVIGKLAPKPEPTKPSPATPPKEPKGASPTLTSTAGAASSHVEVDKLSKDDALDLLSKKLKWLD